MAVVGLRENMTYVREVQRTQYAKMPEDPAAEGPRRQNSGTINDRFVKFFIFH